MRELVKADPDATLSELCQRLDESDGATVSVTTMCRAMKSLRLPLKKRRCTPASGRRRGCGRYLRGHFKKRVAAVDPKRLVFVDESGINTAMTRTRGRAPPGERVPGAVPRGHWTTLTMIGALRLEGMAAEVTVDAATDTDVFGVFVHDALVPALRPGDAVVWDGLSPHRAPWIREEVERARATLLPLPPYSPDLSPIEPCCSASSRKVQLANPRRRAQTHGDELRLLLAIE